MRALIVSLALIGCAGNLPEPGMPVSSTPVHCSALDVESDWGPPIAAGLGAVSAGMVAIDSAPSKRERLAQVIIGAAGVVAGGVGAYASKSWHEQCVPTVKK